MPLSQAQRAVINKARALSAGAQGVALDNRACAYLIALIANDLDLLTHFPELPSNIPPLYMTASIDDLGLPADDAIPLFEKLLAANADADTYFSCLARLYKSRLKYHRILQTQAIPTIDQVGPRGLLQYGDMSNKALTAFLFWRKWLFDIDNRAGQETGILFEPIIATAIGGTPVSASKSPVYRQGQRSLRGRQVDCIRDDSAYEIKIRVTIAASGQGRWSEEIAFPSDCKASGYKPVLVVLDPTSNEKLTALQQAFERQGGEWFVGASAWEHLDHAAGSTMSRFLEKYVHAPIQAMLNEAPERQELPDIALHMSERELVINVVGEAYTYRRDPILDQNNDEPDAIPDDVDEHILGV